MAGEERVTGDPEVPEAGEAIHLPGPSYLPVLVAVGSTIALVGVVINWIVFGFGVAMVAVCVARWIVRARAEMADLPLHHE